MAKRSPRVVWVEEQLRRHPTSRILDVGFVGAYERPFVHERLRGLAPGARLVGLDIDVEAVRRWKYPDTLGGDAKRLPFRDGSFDALLCLEVLEHVYDPFAFLREFARVLRPGGEAIITTPNAYSWWSVLSTWMAGRMSSRATPHVYKRHLGAADHKQVYTPLSLMNLHADAGLVPTSIATRNHAIPGVSSRVKALDLLDWRFYPANRLGHYTCLVSRRADPALPA